MSDTLVVGGLSLVKVRLLKVRGGALPGQVLEVDALRAGILVKNGDAMLVTADDGITLGAAPATPAPVAYYGAGADVYHTRFDCILGNNIEPKNRREGKGGKKLCRECGGA